MIKSYVLRANNEIIIRNKVKNRKREREMYALKKLQKERKKNN